MPDFLDRLLARHAPAAVPRSGVVRVRPRLAGPFERVEAVRAGTPEPDEAESLWPSAAPSPAQDGDVARPAAREVQYRTERERTVVRTERASSEPAPPRPAERAVPEAPLLRPAVPVTPRPRPGPDAPRRTAGRDDAERPSAQSAASVPTPPGMDAASRAAVRQAAGRRPARGAEQVVQVQIGRLEVTAAGAPPGGGSRRPAGTGRPAAALSLAEYLERGSE
ncbi:hypothetical protein [Streptomyces ureilyticus]|uniref:Uncharacterized protein n=1 Tax=Streptomyces ureilyticus TaxID=1775131 RepID=A0ABX0DQZ0_9ACTN|nr:hypothetical protein [Streptomyces ureilyticus]NGO44305.1 hypothetical protein [Streptomyces ureilyticus]